MPTDCRGDITYTDTAVTTLVIMLVLAMSLNIFSFFTLKQDLEYCCEQLVEEAACEGRTDGNFTVRFSQLCTELGFDEADITCSFDGTAFREGSSKVQYGDTIMITLVYHTSVCGTGIFDIPASVSVSSSGISEKYWKS